jgi:hypothetical protein
MPEHKFTIDQYKAALEALVYSQDLVAEGVEQDHQLLLEIDGDGYNEPMSESPRCSCGRRFEHYFWVQGWENTRDNLMKSRADLAVAWMLHERRATWM